MFCSLITCLFVLSVRLSVWLFACLPVCFNSLLFNALGTPANIQFYNIQIQIMCTFGETFIVMILWVAFRMFWPMCWDIGFSERNGRVPWGHIHFVRFAISYYYVLDTCTGQRCVLFFWLYTFVLYIRIFNLSSFVLFNKKFHSC